MKIILALLITSCLAFSSADNISILGIKIHDKESSLKKIKLDTVAVDEGMIKFRTENGNDLSFTMKKGKIVYMENDWLHEANGKKPLFSGFRFGETSLRDIRKTLGTNGFTHTDHAAFTSETELIEFNCFEFDSPNNEIFATVTTCPLDTSITESTIADSLKLAAVIICDKGYLDNIWGEKKVYDDKGHYKKIKPGF